MRFIVEHALYGCECGCCGTAASILDDAGQCVWHEFIFAHYETNEEAAEDYATTFSKKLGRPVAASEVECDIFAGKKFCMFED